MKDLNSVSLTGRLTRDPNQYKTQDGKSVSRFNLAVNGYKDKADFISCCAFNKTADVINMYCHKGSRIAINGSIKTGMYESKQTGQAVHTTDVFISQVVLLDTKKESNQSTQDNFYQNNSYSDQAFYDHEKNIMESYKSDNYAVDDQDIQF